jgi:hypothetical protein
MELRLSAVSTPTTLQSAPVRGYERSSNGSVGHYNLSRKSELSDQDASSHHCGECRGDFVDIQDDLPEYGLPANALFNHPKHRSTLALRLDEHSSTKAILVRLADCDEKFNRHRPSG